MQIKKQQLELDMEQLVTNWERNTSRIYIVTLFIKLLCRVHHENTGLYEVQAGIKIAGRNIKNHRYADGTTLWQKVKN